MLTRSELEVLRHQLDLLPARIASLISRSVPRNKVANNDGYPSPNLYRAQTLYDTFDDIEVSALSVPKRSLLYAQLLRRAGINADLVVNDKGELFVIFGSGVSLDNAKRIAANQQLIYKKPGADTVWIRIQIQSSHRNFTTAWYKGNRR